MIRHAATAALLLAFSPLHLHAQLPLVPTTPRLQEITRLAQDGYGDSARKVINASINRTASTDPEYPEQLFTAATVASNGDDAGRYLKRIVVEFPQSAWADKAQLRLAQLSYGSGHMDDVLLRVTRLFGDYPASPVIPMAALWGARAAFDQQKLQQACDWITRGLAVVGDETEVKNQLLFAKQKCNVGPGVQLAPLIRDSLRAGPPPVTHTPDSTRAPVSPAAPPAAAPVSTATPRNTVAASPWRVQVIAISDKAVIRKMVSKLEAAGFRTYEVPGPHGLTKVQAGPFATRAAAVAGVARVKNAVGGAPFVTAAP